jgi:hypothetical protein
VTSDDLRRPQHFLPPPLLGTLMLMFSHENVIWG